MIDLHVKGEGYKIIYKQLEVPVTTVTDITSMCVVLSMPFRFFYYLKYSVKWKH